MCRNQNQRGRQQPRLSLYDGTASMSSAKELIHRTTHITGVLDSRGARLASERLLARNDPRRNRAGIIAHELIRSEFVSAPEELMQVVAMCVKGTLNPSMNFCAACSRSTPPAIHEMHRQTNMTHGDVSPEVLWLEPHAACVGPSPHADEVDYVISCSTWN